MHNDFYGLSDETSIDTSPHSSNRKIWILEKVYLDTLVLLQQNTSPILNLEETAGHFIDQKAPLMSDMKQQLPDKTTGLEVETVTWKDVTIKLSPSPPILEGYLTATCDQWENGKSISFINTGHTSIAHVAKADSDSGLAHPPAADHPTTPQASLGVLIRRFV